jgi:glycosyltransferase involved in cell wall biosynthesis
MKIIVACVQVPFIRGGAEILVDCLVRELRARGHKVELLSLPFLDQRKEALLDGIRMWSKLDLSQIECDLVICTKFPTYFINHPRKVLWLVHQHRQMYELLGTRFSDFHADGESEAIRRVVFNLEKKALSDCLVIAGISDNVCERLEKFMGVRRGIPILPPLPLGDRYRSGGKGDYILSVGRLCAIKRVDLLVKALPQIHQTLRLKIVGVPDEKNYGSYLQSEIDKHHLSPRIDLLGRVSDDELIELYSNAFAVYYGPYDEDYGFVTLEALASRKPVVTCTDSGGVLAFVGHEQNGLIAQPDEASLARAINRMLEEPELYDRLAQRGYISAPPPSWDHVVHVLTHSVQESADVRI